MKTPQTHLTIPPAIKLYVGFVGLFGLLFAFSSYFSPAQISPAADMSNPATRLAFYTIGSTVLALTIGLLLAILSNRPQSLILLLVVRTLAALQDFFIAFVLGLGWILMAVQAVIFILGVMSVVKLFGMIQAAGKQMENQ